VQAGTRASGEGRGRGTISLAPVGRFGFAVIPALLSACVASTGETVPTQRAATSCPRLDSRLRQLAASDRPSEFARTNALDLTSGGVRVIIEVAQGNDVPARYAVTIDARSGSQIQARVPVDRLCDLAAESSVLRVSPPAARVPEAT
jgi:hypothetical protein